MKKTFRLEFDLFNIDYHLFLFIFIFAKFFSFASYLNYANYSYVKLCLFKNYFNSNLNFTYISSNLALYTPFYSSLNSYHPFFSLLFKYKSLTPLYNGVGYFNSAIYSFFFI